MFARAHRAPSRKSDRQKTSMPMPYDVQVAHQDEGRGDRHLDVGACGFLGICGEGSSALEAALMRELYQEFALHGGHCFCGPPLGPHEIPGHGEIKEVRTCVQDDRSGKGSPPRLFAGYALDKTY
eukprot:6603829-Pyramimonas_sp.AAC.2